MGNQSPAFFDQRNSYPARYLEDLQAVAPSIDRERQSPEMVAELTAELTP